MRTPQPGIQFQVLVSWHAGPLGSKAHQSPSESTSSTMKMLNGSHRANAS